MLREGCLLFMAIACTFESYLYANMFCWKLHAQAYTVTSFTGILLVVDEKFFLAQPASI